VRHIDRSRDYRSYPPLEEPAGYVYIIQDVEISKRYKIGRTTHPATRLNTTFIPVKIEFVAFIPTEDDESTEKDLHNCYAKNRKVREWFDLNKSQLQEIDERAKNARISGKHVPHGISCINGISYIDVGHDFLNSMVLDLSRTNLSGVSLVSAYLSGANLMDADLSGAKLMDADLTDADLSGAKLWKANLTGANLSGADLWKADLSGAKLWKAKLKDARLWGADLSGANLWKAKLKDARLWDANLSGANLSGAKLWDANLSGAKLRSANLTGADLKGAKLRDADLMEANLTNARLWEADLKGAKLMDADLIMNAKFYTSTILPDGTCWCDGKDIKRSIRIK